MAIQNAEVTDFCNKYIRPLAEDMQDSKVFMDAAIVKYATGPSSILSAAPTEVIDDGRAGDAQNGGDTPLTGQDIVTMGTVVNDIRAILEGPGVAEILAKAAVRPPRVR